MAEETENFLVESLYRDVLGEYSTYATGSAKLRIPHWVVPAPNLNLNVLPHVPTNPRFCYQLKRTKPLLLPSNTDPANYWNGDPLDKIVQEKKAWESELKQLLLNARNGQKWADADKSNLNTSKKVKKQEEHVFTVNSHMRVAQHIQQEPYPGFSGDYNWFYTGGCITGCTVNGANILLHPCGKNMDSLSLTDVRQQEAVMTEDESQVPKSLSLCRGQRIHQIVENKGFVGIRQEKVCSLARIKGGLDKPLSAQTRLEIQEKDSFFVGMDLGRLEGKKMCTIDSERLIKLWDLATSTCTSTAKIQPSDNNSSDACWSFVKFDNKSPQLFVLDRSTVLVKDLRMPLSDNSMKFSPNKIIDDCEELTLLLNSRGLPLVYVGTTHQLLSLDMRFGWSQRWTHLMEAPPMYGSIYWNERDSEEVILLSSAIPEDSVAIVNTWEHGKPTSECLPRSVHSLNDSLILARSHGECLGTLVKQRLEMSTSGLTVIPSEDNDGFMAFKSTSIGDVFYQEFVSDPNGLDSTEATYPKEEIDADVEAWKKWSEACDVVHSQTKIELHSPVYCNDFVFKCVKAPLPKSIKDPLTRSVETWRKTFPVKEKRKGNKKKFPFEHDSVSFGQLLYDLSSHTDLMAGILLNAWDSEGVHTDPEPAEKVENWLDKISSFSQGTTSMDEEGFGLNGSLPLVAPSSTQASTLMSMCGGDEVFKVPVYPPIHAPKKRKRESMGF